MSKKSKLEMDLEERLKDIVTKTVSPSTALMRPLKQKDTEEENVTENKKEIESKETKTVKSEKSKTKTEDKKAIVPKDNVIQEKSTETLEEMQQQTMIEPKKEVFSHLIEKRQRIEDTHKRRTFLVRNDLLERLDKLADEIGSTGFRTKFINSVIEYGLTELENIKSKKSD